jgi:HlyD family secretion protein
MWQKILNTIKKKWWVGAIVLVGGGIAIISLQEPVQKVESIQVRLDGLQQFILEEGKTRLDQEYSLTLPVAGEISRLPWKEGDWVEAGQILLQLDRHGRSLEISGLQSKLAEISAQKQGLQTQKPKSSELKTAQIQINQSRMQRKQFQKQREAQEAELLQLQRTLQRQETLFKEQTISQAQVEEIRKQVIVMQKQAQQALLEEQKSTQSLRIAELNLERLKQSQFDPDYLKGVYNAQTQQVLAQLAQKQDDFAKTVLRAPISGPILEVNQRDASVLPAGSQVLKMGDLHSLAVEVDLLSEEMYQIKVGLPVEISGKALQDKIIKGKVSRIFPSGFTKLSALGVEQQRIKVIVKAPLADLKLRPGTRVDVKVITSEKSKIPVIPERALFKQAGKWHVFKIEAGRAQLQAVNVGLKNDDQAEILSGLKVGDLIVAELETSLKAGGKVEITQKK